MFSARPLQEPPNKRLVTEGDNGKTGDDKLPSSSGERQAKDDDDIDNNSSSEDDEQDDDQQGSLSEGANNNDGSKPSAHKRSRRLAMNRASARARRKRKKVLLDSLAKQVTELTKQNQVLEQNSQTLQGRAQQLESALAQSQATITQLLLNSKTQPSASAALLGNVPTVSSLPTRSSLVSDSLQALLGQQEQAVSIDSLLAATAAGGVGHRSSLLSDASEQQKLLEAQLIMAALERSNLQGSNAPAAAPSSSSSSGAHQFFQR